MSLKMYEVLNSGKEMLAGKPIKNRIFCRDKKTKMIVKTSRVKLDNTTEFQKLGLGCAIELHYIC